MKRTVFAGFALAAFATTAATAADYIYLEYNGEKEQIRLETTLEETSVCTLKKMIAEKYDLKMRKFNLRRYSTTMMDDRTLYGAGLRRAGKVNIQEVSNSSQCT